MTSQSKVDTIHFLDYSWFSNCGNEVRKKESRKREKDRKKKEREKGDKKVDEKSEENMFNY